MHHGSCKMPLCVEKTRHMLAPTPHPHSALSQPLWYALEHLSILCNTSISNAPHVHSPLALYPPVLDVTLFVLAHAMLPNGHDITSVSSIQNTRIQVLSCGICLSSLVFLRVIVTILKLCPLCYSNRLPVQFGTAQTSAETS